MVLDKEVRGERTEEEQRMCRNKQATRIALDGSMAGKNFEGCKRFTYEGKTISYSYRRVATDKTSIYLGSG